MRQYSKKLTRGCSKLVDTVELVETISTFNISTASAFCIAAHGVKVAKHGGKWFQVLVGVLIY